LDDLYISVKYNYYHLTKKLVKKKYIENYGKFFETNIKQKEKFNSYTCYRKILPMTLYVIFILILFLWEETRCSLIYWIDRTHFLRKDNETKLCDLPKKFIGDPNEKYEINNPLFNSEAFYSKFIIAEIIKNFINFVEIGSYIYMFLLSKKFRLKKDYFLYFKENFLIIIVWLFFNDILPILNLFKIYNYSNITDYLNNFFRVFSLFVVFWYLNSKRNKIGLKKFMNSIYDFDKFINFPAFFKYFQEYLINHHENSLKYLDFWISFNILMNKILKKKELLNEFIKFKKNNNPFQRKNSNEISDNNNNNPNGSNDTHINIDSNMKKELDKLNKDLKNKILEMYSKYFGYSRVSSSNITDLSSKSQYKIEFPIDMQEKVEDYISKYSDDFKAEEIFEETYNFVYHHLSNIHDDLILKDQDKLFEMLFVINIFEINDDEDEINS